MLDLLTLAVAAVGALASSLSAVADIVPFFQNPKLSNEVKSLTKNVDNLLAKLRAMMLDYQKEVVRKKTKEATEAYKNWIKRVDATTMCIESLIEKCKKLEQNIPSEITEELESLTMEVRNLIEEGNSIKNKLLVRAPPEAVEKMKAPNFQNSETLRDKLDRILKHLENVDVMGVQVSGTMGVGKTAILKNLNNHEKIAKMFDIVIWVKVSIEGDQNNLSIEHIQKSILKRLKIKLKGNMPCDEVASRISRELKGKKYLLLMDDVKQHLDLSDIGIPSIEEDCKIVLTTRQPHVFHDFINVIVKVKSLSNDEAWVIFQDVLKCPSLIKDVKTGSVAWEICKQCGGLPLLIEKVASTFKVKNDARLWRDGLNSWRTWPQKECQGIKEMISFLKICYNSLDSAQKQCFLYGALYPEDSDIYTDYLLERWIAEDFLYIDNEEILDTDNIYVKGNEIVSGTSVLTHLQDVSLLEEGKGDKYVIMHKFIRQVALDISSIDPTCLYLVKTNDTKIESVDAGSWFQKRYISLSNNVDFHELPNQPDASMLSTLFLQKNSKLEEVPNLFFNNMNQLRVLDFCESRITLLPESLPISLKVLCLSDCICLDKLPLVHDEQSYLEVLDICRSGIIRIPTHLEKMKRLRCLRMSLPENRVENDIESEFRTISKLPKLEELVIDMKLCEQSLYKAVISSIITNVASLENFTTLRFSIGDHVENIIDVGDLLSHVQVPDAEILQHFPNTRFYNRAKKSKYFHIFIDCDNTETQGIPDFFKYPVYIKYFNGKGNDLGLSELVTHKDIKDGKSIAFELVAHKDIKELSNFNSTVKITAFFIESCEELETIIGKVNSEALSNIVHLYLDKLPKLESIWKEPLQQLCLMKLETLILSGCPMLTKIFPDGTVQNLIQLQSLTIKNCSEIVEIFEVSGTTGKTHLPPKLMKLIILDMPKLKFISKEKSLEWPALVELRVSKCSNLEYVSITRDNAPKLEVFEIYDLHRVDEIISTIIQ